MRRPYTTIDEETTKLAVSVSGYIMTRRNADQAALTKIKMLASRGRVVFTEHFYDEAADEDTSEEEIVDALRNARPLCQRA